MIRYVESQDDGPGRTRLITVELKQQPAAVEPNFPPLLVTAPIPATAVRFADIPEGLHDVPPHPADTRQLIVALRGRFEIEVSNGDTHQFGPGEFMLAGDLSGAHISRVLEHPARLMFVTLPDDHASTRNGDDQ